MRRHSAERSPLAQARAHVALVAEHHHNHAAGAELGVLQRPSWAHVVWKIETE